MKQIRTFIALSALVLAANGCSSIDFNHDWDRDADFNGYHTFTFINRPTTAVGDAQAARQTNTLLDKRIKSAVADELGERGMVAKESTPDLLIAYHVGLQDKVNVTDYGYRYSYDYYGWGGRSIDVYNYTEGTLIIDLIDANTKELVWRGSATKTVDESSSPEKVEDTIQRAVQGIFSKYPPPQ